nr:HNH endonuclease [uncultured Pseudomonas sp.]
MQEIWLPAPGFELFAEISNAGSVRSIARQVRGRSRKGTEFFRSISAVHLKTFTTSNGYEGISLNGRSVHVHRLVALAFIPNLSDLPCVNHINGIKTDNRRENLEWCTHSENTRHAVKNGLMRFRRGEQARTNRLSENDVRAIRAMLRQGIPQREIAAVFDVSQRAVAAISTGESWSWLA